MSKLVCSKCGGTQFTQSNTRIVYTVYVPNGSSPYKQGYSCANCGHEEFVEYPAVYYEAPKPFEVELPDESSVLKNTDLAGNIPVSESSIASGGDDLPGTGTVCIDTDSHIIFHS